MNKNVPALFASLCLSPVLLFSFATYREVRENPPKARPPSCELSTPRSQRVEVKHVESRGVGYDQGYTSFESFSTVPSTLDNSWVPFLDVRAHVFNNGTPAVNSGVGLRYLGDCRVYGATAYYDYRKTSHFHFNQLGFGLETLGKLWDLRLNAYVPVGKKDSKFHSHKKEIGMIGSNAEIGFHVVRRDDVKFYVAAGPYYFEREARVAWGGEARFAVTVFDYLRVQLNTSYDKIFHGVVQGEVALVFSYGGRRTIQGEDRSCSARRIVTERALQRVYRNEIVVVDKKR